MQRIFSRCRQRPADPAKRSPALATRCSPALATRGSPALATRGSPALATRCSPALATRCSPALATRGSPAHPLLSASWLAIPLLLLVACNQQQFVPIVDDPGLLGVSLGEVAVVTSDYDRIEEILTELEVPFVLYDGFVVGPPEGAMLEELYNESLPSVEGLLSNSELLESYNVLFINCGARGTGTVDPTTLELEDILVQNPRVTKNVANFVENGGALFVSDRSYALLEAALPNLIEFEGADSVPGDAEVGEITSLTAHIDDEALSAYVSSPLISLDFPLSGWVVPQEAEGVWLSGDAPIRDAEGNVTIAPSIPLMIHISEGYGSVTFTSFHNFPAVDQVWMDLQVYLMLSLAEEEQ